MEYPSSSLAIDRTKLYYPRSLKRYFAFFIDFVILSIALTILEAVFSSYEDAMPWLLPVVFIIGWWLYSALMQSSERQATIGMRVLGLRVTDMEGQRITFSRATIRFFASILSFLIFGIGFFMVDFTRKKQSLHDIIAKTLVVLD